MSKSFYFLALFLCVCWTTKTVAQDRYAVFFKFKPQKEYSLGSPSKFLTEKAIQRRVREKFSLDSLDLPVTAAYIQGLGAFSQELLYVSKWLNAAIVVTDVEGKKKMEGLPYVQKVEWVAKGFISRTGNRNSTEVSASQPKKWVREENYRQAAAYDFQNELLGITAMQRGLRLLYSILDFLVWIRLPLFRMFLPIPKFWVSCMWFVLG